MASGVINNKSSISGSISSRSTFTATATSGSGTTDHSRLTNRDADDQHPISAITDLQTELDSKLDSETALPLIEEAVKYKAKGLYYDANKELAKKAYWYLTSEIDDTTKMGTKASIISGPYDLGSGGGSGGVTTMTLTKWDPVTGEESWPEQIAISSATSTIIGINWSSAMDGVSTGSGVLKVTVNSKSMTNRTVSQGNVEIDITDYITTGSNTIAITIVDAYSNTKLLNGVIDASVIEITADNFNGNEAKVGNVTFRYIAKGNFEKTVHFILDDEEIGTAVTSATTEQTYVLSSLLHKNYKFEVYYTCTVNGQELTSNTLKYDLIHYIVGNQTPIIASTFDETAEFVQYSVFNLPFRIYMYGTEAELASTTYTVSVNGTVEQSSNLTTLSKAFSYTPMDYGDFTIVIACKSVTRTFNIIVTKSTIDIKPIENADLQVYLSSAGRSNDDKKTIWSWVNTDATGAQEVRYCEFNDSFNWTTDGWINNESTGNVPALRLIGNDQVIVPFKPFEYDNDLEKDLPYNTANVGKTIEIEFATSDIKDYTKNIISCTVPKVTVTGSVSIVDADDRKKYFNISVLDTYTFRDKIGLTSEYYDTYDFMYEDGNWNLYKYDVGKWNKIAENVNLKEYGITLREITAEEDPEVGFYENGDVIEVVYGTEDVGFFVTPQLAKLNTNYSSVSTQYKEGDHIRVSYVIQHGDFVYNKLIYMYINGILSGVTRYPASVNTVFTQGSHEEAANIILGSPYATTDIFSIRIYKTSLSSQNIVQNWIAETQDSTEKSKRYKSNVNYNSDKITINELTNDVPYMIFSNLTDDILPTSKADERDGDVTYYYPQNTDRNFTTEKAKYKVQGTSSEYYYVKNLKVKFKNQLWTGENFDVESPYGKKYPLRPGATPEATFTLKSDVASSEGANNVVLVQYFENLKNWATPPQKYAGDDSIRVGIDGLPMVGFFKHTVDGVETTDFYGKMNFNNDKGTSSTFGFGHTTDSTGKTIYDESWEILNNSSDLALFKIDDFTDWDQTFESRYPETLEDSSGTEHNYGTQEGELDRLKEMVTWVASTNRANSSYKELTPHVTWEGVTYEYDTPKYRLAKFRNELSNLFDKTCSLFYYLYTNVFLLVDSRAKNAFPTYYWSRTEGDGGNKWFWLPYDMDTAIGTDNTGALLFSYNIEDTDKYNISSYVYNARDSVFWTNIRDAFPEELATMYRGLRSGNAGGGDVTPKVSLSYSNIENLFAEHQSQWSETIFNADAYNKYITPFEKEYNSVYLSMAQGSKAEQRRWWLYNRFRYMDGMYRAGDAASCTMMFRPTEKSTMEISTYADCYISTTYDNDDTIYTTHRVKKDETVEFVPPESWKPEGAQTVVSVQSADMITELGDLYNWKIQGYANFNSGTRLKKLLLGGPSSNESLTTLGFSNCSMLEELNLRNCSGLNGGLDLSNQNNLKTLDIRGTNYQTLKLSESSVVETMLLPWSLTELIITNNTDLKSVTIDGDCKNLQKLALVNTRLDAFEDFISFLENFASNASKDSETGVQKYLNLTSFDLTITHAEFKRFYASIEKLGGCKASGAISGDTPVLFGTLRVDELTYAEYTEFAAKYPDVIIASGVKCTVNFYKYEDVTGSETLQLYETRQCELNDYITEAVVDPARVPSIPFIYTFNYWYKKDDETKTKFDYLNEPITSDLDLYPLYIANDREYTVTYDLQTYTDVKIKIGDVYTNTETKKYNSLLTQPVLENLPTTAEFHGWHTASEKHWDFDTDTILSDMTLYARWTEIDKPSVTLSIKNCNTFNAHCEESTATHGGLAGWALTNSDDTPENWNIIPGGPSTFDQLCTINKSETYYFWVKDSAYPANTAVASIKGQTLEKIFDKDAGVNSIDIYYYNNDTKEWTFIDTTSVFNNYNIKVKAVIDDEHYKDLKLYIDGDLKSNDSEITVTKDLTLKATCTPKDFTLTFNTCGIGTAPNEQIITYKHLASEPAPQYASGNIIEGWYETYDPEKEADEQYSDRWYFDTNVILNDTTLYAKWTPYVKPTTLGIVIPETETISENGYDVMFTFVQSAKNGVQVDWGDDTAISTEPDTSGIDYPVHLTHNYKTSGSYSIKVTCVNGIYRFGFNYNYPAILGENNTTNLLTSIDFSYDVSFTNMWAFRDQTQLASVSLTPYMSKITEACFYNCSKMDIVSMPTNIIAIEDSAFYGCSNISGNIILSDRLTSIGAGAFRNCSSIISITMPDAVSTIGDGAFASCTSLANINIPISLTTLNDQVFVGCSSIKEFDIPESITYIGNNCFAACSNLESVIIRNENLTTGRFLFNETPKLLSAGPIGDVDRYGKSFNIQFAWKYSIPDNVFETGWQQSNLVNVKLPDTITSIGASAFYNCWLLEGINLTEIKSDIHYTESGYTSMLPANLQKIGETAFMYCSALKRIDIPNTVDIIGKNAFRNCDGLICVRLHPKSVLQVESKVTAAENAWFLYTKSAAAQTSLVHIPASISTAAAAKAVYGDFWDAYDSNYSRQISYINDLDQEE